MKNEVLNGFSNPDILLYYVYALEDPRNKRIFYIGKGSKNRVFDHAKDALKEKAKISDKINTIREIISQGHEVKSYVITYNLEEPDAMRLESIIIETLSKFGHNLTNIVRGHHHKKFFISTDEVERDFGRKKLTSLPKNSVVLYINDKNYSKGASPVEIYQSAKEAWIISKDKRDQLEYVVVENKSIVIAVFKITEWYKINSKWGFIGTLVKGSIYVNKRLPKKPNMSTQRRYCIDGINIGKINLKNW